MPAFDDKTHRRYGKLVVLELSSTKYRNKELAIQYRNRMLEMLQQEGIFYEDSHGTRIGE